VISRETSFGAAWWLVHPIIADWWPLMLVGSIVVVLAGTAGINLAVGRIVNLFVPPVEEAADLDDGDGESAETVELPPTARRRPPGTVHASFTCAPASDQTVVLDVSGLRR